jgi:hypothetical protein
MIKLALVWAALSAGAGFLLGSGCTFPRKAQMEHREPVALRASRALREMKSDLIEWANNNVKRDFRDRSIPVQLREFEASLDRLDPGLKFRLGYNTKDYFLVDANVAGASYGCKETRVYTEPNEGDYSQGVAWVIPVAGYENRKALILISNISPKRTTLLLINHAMKASLLYDSSSKHSILAGSSSGIDYLCGLEVVKSNHFLLHECWLRGMSQASLFPRSFLLTVRGETSIGLKVSE